ncbi:amidohydrolase family protein [Granulicella sibirica]|uniref:L-fuconolactone hydrolase n=1 Tax=Granulicella sibirica TaxID=2479048 RepID=A0A4Q0SUQ5_9BACT|nr:amidohydrolase family protein [Granulicella sibirica]RXH54765.1 L-fuconolactone hydrolase [Granulicella sibirica]
MASRIDSHHHLWTYDPEEFSWITPEMAAIRRDFLPADLEEQLAPARIDGTVVVQARQTVEETEWLLGVARSSDKVLGVVGWLPIASEYFEQHLERFAGADLLKGLRHVVQGEDAGFLDGTAFNKGISRLKPHGLVYDLLIYSGQMEEALRFVDRHPNQPFVLDHVGKPGIRRREVEPWKKWIGGLGKRPNVSCKVSGMVTEADWTNWNPATLSPYFETVLEAFGAARLMVGTDWPVVTLGCSYSKWWEIVEEWVANLSEAEQAGILGENAARIYRLKT